LIVHSDVRGASRSASGRTVAETGNPYSMDGRIALQQRSSENEWDNFSSLIANQSSILSNSLLHPLTLRYHFYRLDDTLVR
jgi:hypothetical protein